jgi:predicted nicotinamide N-methyase
MKLLKGFPLFLISFLYLFFELALIRYIPGNIRFVAYYSNIILISAFLGLGIGCLRPKKRNTINYFSWVVTITVFLIILFKFLFVKPFSIISAEYIIQASFPVGAFPMEAVIPAIFLINAVFFYPLGQVLGSEIEKFPPLLGYSINISGNLLGILAFVFFSLFWISPLTWFLIGFILSLFLFNNPNKIFISSLLFVLNLFVIFSGTKNEIWSPYYKITLLDRFEIKFLGKALVRYNLPEGFYILNVDDDTFQAILNLSPEFIEKLVHVKNISRVKEEGIDLLLGMKRLYEFPYNFINPKNVLVLGAGAGNDVAAALRMGAERVDAVDIDPVIIDTGKRLHPERPYQSERVSVHIDDARSFVSKSNSNYDLIVYGFLDSHRLLSSMSSVRLENYVYTVESLTDAKRLLSEDGLMSIAFASSTEWVSQKVFYMIKNVFGEDVEAYEISEPYLKVLKVFVAGPGLKTHTVIPEGFKNITDELSRSGLSRSLIPSDDWPFLYLRERKIPNEYLFVIGSILIISLIFMVSAIKKPFKADLHFFFLGSGFLLLETKSITECALLFGATWLTTSVVISSFMMMILISNFLSGRAWIQRIHLRTFYFLLFLALIINYIIPVRNLLPEDIVLRVLLSSLFIGFPVLFAGIIFALTFRRVSEPHSALGSNILGCVVGGVSEYICMIFGIKVLYILALGFYILSFFSILFKTHYSEV